MKVVWTLVALTLGVFFALRGVAARPVDRPPGILAPSAPAQLALSGARPFALGDATAWPQATFDLTARVLATKTYADEGAKYAPIDVAFGWGRLSDTSVLRRLSVSQLARFLRVEWSGEAPLDLAELTASAANMHLIPANDTVARQLRRLRPGHVAHLSGLLVNLARPDGWTWTSSLSRTDSGDGACEIVYVQSVTYR